MKNPLIFIALLLFAFICKAQTHTYISYDISAPTDKFTFTESTAAKQTNDSLISFSPNRTGTIGLVITQQLGDESLLHLELGAYLEHFGASLTHKGANEEEKEEDIFSFEQKQLLFPLKFSVKEKIIDEKVLISAGVGASYVIDWFDKYKLDNYPEVNNNMLTVENFSFNEKYYLLGWEVGADVRLFDDCFSVGLRYRQNYNTRTILNIDVNTKNGTYNINSKGNFNALAFAITYRISKLWD